LATGIVDTQAVGPRDSTRRTIGFLAPSLTDILFFAMLFWLFMADPLGWDRLLWDGDTALHTRTGDYILDHGHVPTADPFSFTKPGERWFAFQWLTGVLFAGLNRFAGLKGIVLLCGVLIALTFTVLARDMIRRGSNGLLTLLLVMMAANASALHFHARPHLFTLFFLVITNFLVAGDRAHPCGKIWLLVPLMIAWVNLHSGFPVMLTILGLLVMGCALSRDWTGLRRYVPVLAACALATLINPNGIALHLHISKFLNSKWAMDNINEYQSPVFRSETMYFYMAILFLALAVSGRYFARRQWTECLWILFFAIASLTSARHIPLFAVTALPLIGVELTNLWGRLTARRARTSVLAVLADMSNRVTGQLRPISVWAAAIVAGVALFGNPQNWPTDLSEKYFPRGVVREFADQLAASHVFTTDQWGDYLLWTGYPRQKVFIDGRSDFFGEKIGSDYAVISNGQPGWRERLDSYGVDMILVPPQTPLVELLLLRGGWRVLHRDSDAILLARTRAGDKDHP
jgi:hypothetical protein